MCQTELAGTLQMQDQRKRELSDFRALMDEAEQSEVHREQQRSLYLLEVSSLASGPRTPPSAGPTATALNDDIDPASILDAAVGVYRATTPCLRQPRTPPLPAAGMRGMRPQSSTAISRASAESAPLPPNPRTPPLPLDSSTRPVLVSSIRRGHEDVLSVQIDQKAKGGMDVEALEEQLRSFYTNYAPERVEHARQVATDYLGDYGALNQALLAKYGADLCTLSGAPTVAEQKQREGLVRAEDLGAQEVNAAMQTAMPAADVPAVGEYEDPALQGVLQVSPHEQVEVLESFHLLGAMEALRNERGRSLQLEHELDRVRMWGKARVNALDQQMDQFELKLVEFMVEVGERENEREAARSKAISESATLSLRLLEVQKVADELQEAREWQQKREMAAAEELQEERSRFEEARIGWEMERERAKMQEEVREWEREKEAWEKERARDVVREAEEVKLRTQLEEIEAEREAATAELERMQEMAASQQGELMRLEEERSRLQRMLESQLEDARSMQLQAVEHENTIVQKASWMQERERDMKHHLSVALDEQQHLRNLLALERSDSQRLKVEIEDIKDKEHKNQMMLAEMCGSMSESVSLLEREAGDIQTCLVAVFKDLKQQEQELMEKVAGTISERELEKQAVESELSSYVDVLSSNLYVAAAEFQVQAHSAHAEAAALDRIDHGLGDVSSTMSMITAALERQDMFAARRDDVVAERNKKISSADRALELSLQTLFDSVDELEGKLACVSRAADTSVRANELERSSRNAMLEDVTRSWLEATSVLQHTIGESESVQKDIEKQLRDMWHQVKHVQTTLEPMERMVLDDRAQAYQAQYSAPEILSDKGDDENRPENVAGEHQQAKEASDAEEARLAAVVVAAVAAGKLQEAEVDGDVNESTGLQDEKDDPAARFSALEQQLEGVRAVNDAKESLTSQVCDELEALSQGVSDSVSHTLEALLMQLASAIELARISSHREAEAKAAFDQVCPTSPAI